MADNGIRVPARTHAPLTLSGFHSPAGQVSRFVIFSWLLVPCRSR